MPCEKAQPFFWCDRFTAIGIHFFTNVVQKVFAGRKVCDMSMKYRLLRMVQVDESISIFVVVVKPLPKDGYLNIIWYCKYGERNNIGM